MRMFLITALCVFFSALSQAQQDDYQLRLLFHKQVVLGNEQGLAFWTAMPDVTQTQPHRTVLLGGWLHKDAGNWQEVMGGMFMTFDGKIKPIFDIRLYSGGKRVDIFNEIMIRPDLVDIQAFVTTRLPWNMRAGLEWDIITPLGDQTLPTAVRKKTLFGPRLSAKIPKAPWLQVATVCFFDFRGGTVVRTYILATK